MSFRRAGTALLTTAALALLGGCWWHDSEVPAIEADDRPRRSPLQDGVYCPLQADTGGLALEEDCARLVWDRSERRLRVSEVGGLDSTPGETLWLDVARLSDGLSVLQNTVVEDDGSSSYELFAILPTRRGYVTVPLPEPAVRDAIAAEEGVTVEPSEAEDDYGSIVAGDPAAVRKVVERSALAWLRAQRTDQEAEEGDDPDAEDRLAPYDPNAAEDAVQPLYSIRVETLDDDEPQAAELDDAVADLRHALERVARR